MIQQNVPPFHYYDRALDYITTNTTTTTRYSSSLHSDTAVLPAYMYVYENIKNMYVARACALCGALVA